MSMAALLLQSIAEHQTSRRPFSEKVGRRILDMDPELGLLLDEITPLMKIMWAREQPDMLIFVGE